MLAMRYGSKLGCQTEDWFDDNYSRENERMSPENQWLENVLFK